jgi:hypothetical protein
MTDRPSPPFAVQRLLFVALLGGMVAPAIVFAAVLASNDWRGLGDPPVPELGWAATLFGIAIAPLAMLLRGRKLAAADGAPPGRQGMLRFQARLLPIAMLEGGVLLNLVAWLLNGAVLPTVPVAAVLFALAVVLTPFSDPDAAH